MLTWDPMDHMTTLIPCLRWEREELARVRVLADDSGWIALVARHRPYERQPSAVAPTRAAALKWAERWVRANLVRCLAEVKPMRQLQCGTMTRAA